MLVRIEILAAGFVGFGCWVVGFIATPSMLMLMPPYRCTRPYFVHGVVALGGEPGRLLDLVGAALPPTSIRLRAAEQYNTLGGSVGR
jgi:hypothetical protein